MKGSTTNLVQGSCVFVYGASAQARLLRIISFGGGGGEGGVVAPRTGRIQGL